MWLRDANGNSFPRWTSTGNRSPSSTPSRSQGRSARLPAARGTRTGGGSREGVAKPGWLGLIGCHWPHHGFGHSVLAMCGKRRWPRCTARSKSPKLANFKKAALVIFTYALILTTTVSFFAVLLIPDEVRMRCYADKSAGGSGDARDGAPGARLILNALVVAAGFLILSGAVNTSIIGSNGVLNRVAEDGVLPDRLLRPHPVVRHDVSTPVPRDRPAGVYDPRFRGGDMILLGEAYAFGVLWSFFFNALSMLVLRFKRPGETGLPRAAQREDRRRRDSCRDGNRVSGAGRLGGLEPVHQGTGDGGRLWSSPARSCWFSR